jgi:hypothetical protein
MEFGKEPTYKSAMVVEPSSTDSTLGTVPRSCWFPSPLALALVATVDYHLISILIARLVARLVSRDPYELDLVW